MSTVNNIPTGLLVPAQVPLDAKLYIADEASLMNLGIASNLAYTYYEGMIVYCVAEKRRYEWREGAVGEVGLLPTGFTYPSPLVVNGVTYSNRTFNFFIVVQNMNISNVGTGVGCYKGFNIPTNSHQFKSFTSTGFLITSVLNEINLETKPGVNLNGGAEVYKGVNDTTKVHEFRTLKSITAGITITQVGDEIRFSSSFYNTIIQGGTGITVTGTGTALNPYIISLTPTASPWLRGDIKWIYCDATYLANNFVASGTTEGLGVNERAGWAICNGRNGTPNDKGKVYIAYGKLGTGTNYPTLDATGGSEDAVLVEHTHTLKENVYKTNYNLAGGGAPYDDTVQSVPNDSDSISTEGVSGVGKNMQPYVVRLCIMKL